METRATRAGSVLDLNMGERGIAFPARVSNAYRNGPPEGRVFVRECVANQLFRRAARIDIGGVEHVQPGFEADVDESRRFRGIGAAQEPKNCPTPPKVPVPKLSAGTMRPEPASCLYSISECGFCEGAFRCQRGVISKREPCTFWTRCFHSHEPLVSPSPCVQGDSF